jgi:hypothetical protein
MRANRMDDGRLAVYCCYPPEARGLAPEKHASADEDADADPDEAE